MKSGGEVMGIGRSFNEVLQKACQSLEINRLGLGTDGRQERNLEKIMESLENPSWDRLFYIWDAISLGVSITSIQKAKCIDRWFIMHIYELVLLEGGTKRFDIHTLPKESLMKAKEKGFSDATIAGMRKSTERRDSKKRKK